MTTHVTPEMVPIMAEYHNGSVSLAKKEDSEVVAESVGGVVGDVGGVVGGVVADAALLAELVMLSPFCLTGLQPCNANLPAPAGWEFV